MYETIDRLGYVGFKRKHLLKKFDEQYGVDNWRISWQWGETILPQSLAVQLYEDAYHEFFKSHLADLDWIVKTASDVYDISPKDIESGLDYSAQNQTATHLQDIAIRRVILRLDRKFGGDHLVQIRGKNSEGARYNPGFIKFHLPKMIVKPSLTGWWQEDSIEDFYQSNKILQVRKN